MSSTSLLGLSLTLLAAAQASLSSNQLIAGALLPLPEQLRAHATVVRLDGSFRPEVLRKGTNGMVCIADAPNDAPSPATTRPATPSLLTSNAGSRFISRSGRPQKSGFPMNTMSPRVSSKRSRT